MHIFWHAQTDSSAYNSLSYCGKVLEFQTNFNFIFHSVGAGVGHIGVLDFDTVEISNLHRWVITFYISVSVCSLLVTSTLSVKEMVVEKIVKIMIMMLIMTLMMMMIMITTPRFIAYHPGKWFIAHHLKEQRNVTQQLHVWEPSMTQ